MTSEYSIVGSGVGGMACAMRLIASGTDPRSISLFDAESTSNGRLLTHYGNRGSVCELGPARFNLTIHRRLSTLTQLLDAELTPFSFQREYDSSISPSLLARLRSIDLKSCFGQGMSLIGALGMVAGPSDAQLYCALTGYDALASRKFPLEGALEMLRSHPESFIAEGGMEGWVAPKDGFGSLAERMHSSLSSLGVVFHYGMRLTRIVDTSGPILLEFRSATGLHLETLEAHSVVLAVSAAALRKIEHPWTQLDR